MAITDTDIKKLKTIFATKDDLKRFATKDDLKNYPTKDDLRFALAHQKDEILDTMTQLLTQFKSDILNTISSFAKEIQENREERVVLASQVSRNTKRIEVLESKLAS